MIKISNLTMIYPGGKGVFDINFDVARGQVVGFIGPNGAGKTTTIRCLLGFMRGNMGSVCTINDRDCFEHAHEILADVGFIAGEPVLPDNMRGDEYLSYIARIRSNNLHEKEAQINARAQELCDYFEIVPNIRIKRMSKGMKQKIALISAFMHEPSVYILDEPSSGLDPVMQTKFIDLVLAEKARGKTVLMSTHIYDEVERTADIVVIIKDGRIIANDKALNLKQKKRSEYVVDIDYYLALEDSVNSHEKCVVDGGASK